MGAYFTPKLLGAAWLVVLSLTDVMRVAWNSANGTHLDEASRELSAVISRTVLGDSLRALVCQDDGEYICHHTELESRVLHSGSEGHVPDGLGACQRLPGTMTARV